MTPSPTSTETRRGRWARVRLTVAGALGSLVGVVGRGLPGVAGAVLVCYGVWLAWPPLGFVAAGGFLLLLDRRVA